MPDTRGAVDGGAATYVYVSGYTAKGPVRVTWGRTQQMTWAWFATYCDEAYVRCAGKNRFKKRMIEAQVVADSKQSQHPFWGLGASA